MFRTALEAQIPAAQHADAANADLVVQVRVETDEKGVSSASLIVLDRPRGMTAGRRDVELSGASCKEAADTVALVIGVLIEAGQGAPLPPLPSPPPPPPRAPAPATPEPAREPAPPHKRITHTRWLGPDAGHDMEMGVGPSYGVVPGVGWVGTFSWGIRPAIGWPFYLSASGWLPSSHDRARVSAWVVQVATCPWSPSYGRWHLRACPALAAGQVQARGHDFLEGRTVKEVLPLVRLESAATLHVAGSLTVGLVTRLGLPLLRPRFVAYRDDGSKPTLAKVAPVVAEGILTLGLRFR